MAEIFPAWSVMAPGLEACLLALLALALVRRVTRCRSIARLGVFDIGLAVTLGVAILALAHGKDTTPYLAFGLMLLGFQIAALPGHRARPVLLVHRGEVLAEAIRQENISRQDIDRAIRAAGYADLGQVQAVVLEEDRSLAVITPTADGRQDRRIRP